MTQSLRFVDDVQTVILLALASEFSSETAQAAADFLESVFVPIEPRQRSTPMILWPTNSHKTYPKKNLLLSWEDHWQRGEKRGGAKSRPKISELVTFAMD